MVVEKGSEVGAHILSGAVIDPIGLDRLVPDWREDPERPLEDRGHARRVPLPHRRPAACACRNWPMPKLMSNHGNFIVSLGNVCRYLGAQGRGARGRDLSGLSGRRGAGRRREPRRRRRDRRLRHRQATASRRTRLHPRHGAARQVHRLRRGRARQPDEAAHPSLQPRPRPRPPEIRHRHQGAMAGRSREA